MTTNILLAISMIVNCIACFVLGMSVYKAAHYCANEKLEKYRFEQMSEDEKKARDKFMKQFDNLMNYNGGEQK